MCPQVHDIVARFSCMRYSMHIQTNGEMRAGFVETTRNKLPVMYVPMFEIFVRFIRKLNENQYIHSDSTDSMTIHLLYCKTEKTEMTKFWIIYGQLMCYWAFKSIIYFYKHKIYCRVILINLLILAGFPNHNK